MCLGYSHQYTQQPLPIDHRFKVQVAEIYLKREEVRSELTQGRWPQSLLPLLQEPLDGFRDMFPLPYASSPPS